MLVIVDVDVCEDWYYLKMLLRWRGRHRKYSIPLILRYKRTPRLQDVHGASNLLEEDRYITVRLYRVKVEKACSRFKMNHDGGDRKAFIIKSLPAV